MPTLYLYDAASDRWWPMDNPLPGDLTEALLAANRFPGCTCTDADIEFGYRCTHPDVSIVHDQACAS